MMSLDARKSVERYIDRYGPEAFDRVVRAVKLEPYDLCWSHKFTCGCDNFNSFISKWDEFDFVILTGPTDRTKNIRKKDYIYECF